MRLPSSLAGKAALGAVALLVVLAAGLGAAVATGAFSAPTVESVESGWGEVTAEHTAIESSVVVHYPNPVGVPAVVGVGASVEMNGIRMAPAETESVGLGPGNNTLSISTRLNNSKIPRWWASHVANGERTTIAVRPTVSAPFVSRQLPARERTFETDLLAAFTSDRARTLAVGGQDVVRISGTSAEWGDPTVAETPLTLEASVTNEHDRPVAFEGVGYTVTMNGVTVANGTDDGVSVSPGETATLRVDAAIQNRKLTEWWRTHVRNDEVTNLSVDVHAVVTVDGERTTVPLSALSRSVRFETDMLGSEGASTTVLDRGDAFAASLPELRGVQQRWTPTGAETTEMSATATVFNPNDADAPLTRLLRLDLGYEVSANDVTLASGTRTGVEVPPGESTLAVAESVPGERIQRWWVSHVNAGEETTRRVTETVTADVGFTTLTVRDRTAERTVETSMLAGVRTNDPQRVTSHGRTVFVVEYVDAWWKEATMKSTPFHTVVGLRNPSARPVTVTEVTYEVRMNGVEMAVDSVPKSTVVDPGERETVGQTVRLQTGKVDDWWVTHLENGQRTDVEVVYRVTVESGGQTRTVTLDGTNTTVTTAFAGA